MQHYLSKSSIRTYATKALVVTVIALLMCSNLALARRRLVSEPLTKKVEDQLTAATSRFAFKLYASSLNNVPATTHSFLPQV